MRSPTRQLAVAAALLALACASDRAVRRPAHSAFPKNELDDVWKRSVRALEAQGYQLDMSDQVRGILLTRERELQAPCGTESCLSRERVFLRLTTGGQAILNISREHFDAATRRWGPASDATSVAAVEKAERELLEAVVGGNVSLRRSGLEEPCGEDGECEGGLACYARRCLRTCDNNHPCPGGQICSSPMGGACQSWPLGGAQQH